MFVAGVYDRTDAVIFSASALITDEHQIDSLRRSGAVSVLILPDEAPPEHDRPAVVPPDADAWASETVPGESIVAYAQYVEQLKEGGEKVRQTRAAVRDAMDAIKMGRVFLSRNVLTATEALVTEVIADPDLYFGLTQIKSLSEHAYMHSVNVAIFSAAFAHSLSYSADKTRDIAIGAMLHDIGMMRLPQDLWLRRGNFTPAEVDVYRTHPSVGIEIIDANRQKIPALSRTIIAQHHERWNGGGFPRRLSGLEVNETAFICTLADTYDLLTTKTPYRRASLPQEAMAAIFQQVGEEFPRTLVEQFTRLLGVYPVGSFVRFITGEMGLVIRINRSHLLSPAVLMLFDKKSARIAKPYVRDLSAEATMLSGRPVYKIDTSLDPFLFRVNPSSIFGVVAG
jgi:putative nucleotidyltransferase with HDIG domain